MALQPGDLGSAIEAGAQPTGVSTRPVTLTSARERIAKKTYIRVPRYPQAAFDAALVLCKSDPT